MQSNQENINKIFQDRISFEKELLNVFNDNDRAEVTRILAATLVQDILKYEINFLFITNLSAFTLKQVANTLFKEITNEWIDYAMDEFAYTKEEAFKELKTGNRAQLIKLLSNNYYKNYKEYIFTEIIDTFMELLVLNAENEKYSIFINSVINSSLIPNRSLLNINSSDQLCKFAKAANELKNEKLDFLQTRIKETSSNIHNLKLTQNKKNELSTSLLRDKKKIQTIQDAKLEKFDTNLQRVSKAMIEALKKIDN